MSFSFFRGQCVGRSFFNRYRASQGVSAQASTQRKRSWRPSWAPFNLQNVQLRSSLSAREPPARTWVDRFPAPFQPYLYLTRIDKPIGTLLLFYPCGPFTGQSYYTIPLDLPLSVVYYHGIIRARFAIYRADHLSWSLRCRGTSDARCGLHHQRYVGSEPRQSGWLGPRLILSSQYF